MKRTLTTLVAWLAVAGMSWAEEPSPYRWSGVERVVALGDVHGAAHALTRMLIVAELIDETGRWTGGKAHLVLLGDLIDRGDGGRQILEMLMRLEREAVESGGRVHVLMGNHEAMNLVRDLRYVTPGDFTAFADDEDPKLRKRMRRLFLRASSASGSREEREQIFESRHPPGYFARQLAFDADGPIGEWLLQKPAVVMINGLIYSHAGISAPISELDLTRLNGQLIGELQTWLDSLATLEERDFVHRLMEVGSILAVSRKIVDAELGRFSAETRQAAATLTRFEGLLAFREDGPLWYRGYSVAPESELTAEFEAALARYGARGMVIAHSTTEDGKITSRLGGKLFRTDVGLCCGGPLRAFEWRGGEPRVIDAAGEQERPQAQR